MGQAAASAAFQLSFSAHVSATGALAGALAAGAGVEVFCRPPRFIRSCDHAITAAQPDKYQLCTLILALSCTQSDAIYMP